MSVTNKEGGQATAERVENSRSDFYRKLLHNQKAAESAEQEGIQTTNRLPDQLWHN